MAVTIRKMKQPHDSPGLKKGKTFFRVSSNGATVQDFKMKIQATRLANRLRR